MTTLQRAALPAVLLGLFLLGGGPAGAQEDGGPARSVEDGVYTEAQARRGGEVLRSVCSVCHQESYFQNASFHEPWAGEPTYFLFRSVLTRMPDDMPGILSRQEVADALAYILRLNGFPAGSSELPTEDEPLREILWKQPAGTYGSPPGPTRRRP